jgi:hypothetical protein
MRNDSQHEHLDLSAWNESICLLAEGFEANVCAVEGIMERMQQWMDAVERRLSALERRESAELAVWRERVGVAVDAARSRLDGHEARIGRIEERLL